MPTSQIPEVGNRWNSHWNSRLENGPVVGIPGNSQKRAVFEPGIPMGIPAIPDLGDRKSTRLNSSHP